MGNRKRTRLPILLLMVALVSSINVASSQKESTVAGQAQSAYVKIFVDGLSCPFCAYGLEKNLMKVKGAQDVFISVANGYTTFRVPKDNIPTKSDLSKIVEDAGFTAREIAFSEAPFPKEKEDE